MQETNATHKELLENPSAWVETRIVLVNDGVISDEKKRAITIGGVALRVTDNAPGNGHGEDELIEVTTTARIFSQQKPTIGSCVSSEIDISMTKPWYKPPRMGCIKPYVRLTDGTKSGNWIQKGVFWIDTREEDRTYEEPIVTYHGYDSMMKAEIDCPVSGSLTDKSIVQSIASAIGVNVESSTLSMISKGYQLSVNDEYSAREVLGYIAGAYGGCFMMTDVGNLRLVKLKG